MRMKNRKESIVENYYKQIGFTGKESYYSLWRALHCFYRKSVLKK